MPDFYFAQIDVGGVAINILHTDEPISDPSMIEVQSFNTTLLGMRWTGSTWAPGPVIVEPRQITRRAFRNRFTISEQSAIEWAAVDKADASTPERMQSATLRAYLKLQDQASFIDLDDPTTRDGVMLLESAGLIAEGRANAILGAEIQTGERL